MVSSSNNGVTWRRRIASRARPTSTFLNISPSNSRSSTNAFSNLLARAVELCCSRSSAARIAHSKSGVIRSPQFFFSPHNQMSISLVAECSRMLRSSIVRSSACCPVSFKMRGICATIRPWLASMRRKARSVQPAPSAAGSACKTRFSFAAGKFGRIDVRRFSSSTIIL